MFIFHCCVRLKNEQGKQGKAGGLWKLTCGKNKRLKGFKLKIKSVKGFKRSKNKK